MLAVSEVCVVNGAWLWEEPRLVELAVSGGAILVHSCHQELSTEWGDASMQ